MDHDKAWLMSKFSCLSTHRSEEQEMITKTFASVIEALS